MSNEHIPAILAEILDGLQKTPRHTRQVEIETRIMDFNPSAGEAAELLEALTAAIQKRYGEDSLEVALYASHLKNAMERLDTGAQTSFERSEVDEIDSFKAARARRET